MGIRKIKTIKNMNIRILYRTFFAFYILLTTGCDPEQESWDICKLNEHLGIDLTSSSIVLSASDGGGKRKDISYEHYFWTLYSPVPVKMPSEIKTIFPLEGDIKYIESRMYKKKMKISQAQYAFFSDWKKNGYIFRAKVVRTLRGDFLVVERIREK